MKRNVKYLCLIIVLLIVIGFSLNAEDDFKTLMAVLTKVTPLLIDPVPLFSLLGSVFEVEQLPKGRLDGKAHMSAQ